MKILVEEIRLYPLRYFKAVLRHMGPEFWIVATFPYYISWIWASGEIFPGLDWLENTPTVASTYLETFGLYMGQTWEFWLGAIVIGPLLGGGTVLYDDFFDHDIDKKNPRKSSLPFQKVQTRPRIILGSSGFLFVISLVLALLISPGFFVISALIVALSLLYSSPPFRFKGRGGLDLLTNMLGFGVLCSMAGHIIAAPIGEYPWLWLVPMIFGTGCLYILTTIADMRYDGDSNIQTIAVKLGLERAAEASMVLLFIANVAILSLGLNDYLYSPEVIHRVWPISILEFLPIIYLRITRNEDVILWVIFFTGSLMAIGTFLLALNHVGIWVV